MARSVSYAFGSMVVLYAYFECEEEDDVNFMWEDKMHDLKYQIGWKFPSVKECDKWLGREDHAILENKFAYFGVSEYCGLVSIWVVPKQTGIARKWCLQVEESLGTIVEDVFGNRLKKVGTFSNGEGVYEKVVK